LRAKLPQLRQALRGRFRGHHALLVRLAVAHLEQLEASIAELDTHIDRVIAPFAQARDRLDTITGVGRRAAECMIGRDRGGHVGVPHRLTPGLVGALAARATTPSGGKRRSGKPTKGNRWLGEVLIECAWAGGPQPRHLPVGPVLAAGAPHRQEEGGGRGGATRSW
jgi:transposase